MRPDVRPKLDAATEVVLTTLQEVFNKTTRQDRVNLFAHLNNQDFRWLYQQVILYIHDQEIREHFQTTLHNREKKSL